MINNNKKKKAAENKLWWPTNKIKTKRLKTKKANKIKSMITFHFSCFLGNGLISEIADWEVEDREKGTHL